MKLSDRARIVRTVLGAFLIVGIGAAVGTSGNAAQSLDGDDQIHVSRVGDIDVAVRSHTFISTNNAARPAQPIPGGLPPSNVTAVAWSPDGSQIASAEEWGNKLSVWDRHGAPIQTMLRKSGPVLNIGNILSFVRGSSELIFPSSGGVAVFEVWNVATGQINSDLPHLMSEGRGPGHPSGILTVSSDQKLIASGSMAEKNVAIYDAATRKQKITIPTANSVSALAFFPGGDKIAIADFAAKFTLADSRTGTVLKTFELPHEENPRATNKTKPTIPHLTTETPASALAVSSDGAFLFAGTNRNFTSTYTGKSVPQKAIQVFRTLDGTRSATFDLARPPIHQAVWGPQDRYVAFIDDANCLYLWQPRAKQPAFLKVVLPYAASSIAVHDDALVIGSAGGIFIITAN